MSENIGLITILMFALLFLFMAFGFEIHIGLGAVAVLFIIFMWGPHALGIISAIIFRWTRMYTVMSIPLFVFYGSGLGSSRVMIGPLVREFFGRNNFATITGFMNGTIVLVGIAGAPLAGWVFDIWSSYRGLWSAFAGLMVVAVISMVTTPAVDSSTGLANEA